MCTNTRYIFVINGCLIITQASVDVIFINVTQLITIDETQIIRGLDINT